MSDNAGGLPSTMKAAVLRAYDDDASVALDVVDKFPAPTTPTGNGVVVRVNYAATNPIDYKIMQGPYRYLLPKSLPRVPGFDVAGTVAAVGPAVKKVRVGQRVMGDAGNFGQGALAEFCHFASEDMLAVVPDHVALADAAGVPLPASRRSRRCETMAKCKREAKWLFVVRRVARVTMRFSWRAFWARPRLSRSRAVSSSVGRSVRPR